MSQFFTSDGQSIRVSASASVFPMYIQNWSPLGWTGWIFLQFKRLSRVLSNTTVQKHQKYSQNEHILIQDTLRGTLWTHFKCFLGYK